MLRAVILTLHHNPCRLVGNTHGGVGFVNVLTAGTGCTVGIDAQVGRVDFDFDGIVDFRVHKHGRERRMAFVVRVKRRVAHQAVNAGFGAQQAVGVFAFHADGGAVDARDFAVVFFKDFDFEAFALGVAAVHAEQHARPVFGFGTARACGDVDKAVVRVGRLVEHSFKFEVGHLFFQTGHVFLNGGETFFVVFFNGHFNQHAVVFDA